VAGPRRHALCPLSDTSAAAAGGLRSYSLRLRTGLSHTSFRRCWSVGNLGSPVSDSGQVCVLARPRWPGLIQDLDRYRSEARAHKFTSNNVG
jgi:hypothetical protein